jgi:mannose-1-phosphate guanylyltransferase/mannose-6-phosphate isomerase
MIEWENVKSMNPSKLFPVILSGGSGTRMWPLSRAAYPKQYLSLHGSHSLLQQTVLRTSGIEGAGAPIVITNDAQRFLVAEQLREIGVAPGRVVLEPVGRNTAPAVAVAALLALRETPDAMLLVLASDHVIVHETTFVALMNRAMLAAGDGALVTFGILPTEPHTGYGYIRRGKSLGGEGVFCVEAFVEKPDAGRAAQFLQEGGYYWNSGMFMFSAQAYLAELERLRPEILAACRAALEHGQQDLDFLRLSAPHFEACPSDSIDYAVMEHTRHAAVLEAADIGWSDIGSWSALAEISGADADGNFLKGDVLVEGAKNSYVRAESRLVAVVGITDAIVVETADAVLVARKDCVQDVKKITERLRAAGRSEATLHRKVYRPWGSYEGVDSGERFQVKRIVVKPGATLSLQMHYHRAEHWVVVRGTAKVVNGEKEILLSENQSVYIPLGVRHRLENPGKLPLELIEVQSGAYLGEDDIVRFQDQYGRS